MTSCGLEEEPAPTLDIPSGIAALSVLAAGSGCNAGKALPRSLGVAKMSVAGGTLGDPGSGCNCSRLGLRGIRKDPELLDRTTAPSGAPVPPPLPPGDAMLLIDWDRAKPAAAGGYPVLPLPAEGNRGNGAGA